MKKKINISFQIIALILLFASLSATFYLVKKRQEIRSKAAPAASLVLSPSTSSPLVGTTFNVDVNIDTGGNEVMTAELFLSYDSNSIKLTGISPGSFVNGIEIINQKVEADRGSAVILVPYSNDLQATTGTLAIFNFETIDPGEAIIRIDAGTELLAVGEQGNVLVSIPAPITIQPALPTPTPTATPRPTPTLTPTPAPTLTPTPAFVPAMIQGRRVSSPGLPDGRLATVTIKGVGAYPLNSHWQVYGTGNILQAGTNYSISTSVPFGFKAYYSVCYNCIDHPGSSYLRIKENIEKIIAMPTETAPGLSFIFADVYWKYISQGDIDKDENLDLRDYVRLIEILRDKYQNKIENLDGDIDENGKLNLSDYVYLIELLRDQQNE